MELAYFCSYDGKGWGGLYGWGKRVNRKEGSFLMIVKY